MEVCESFVVVFCTLQPNHQCTEHDNKVKDGVVKSTEPKEGSVLVDGLTNWERCNCQI